MNCGNCGNIMGYTPAGNICSCGNINFEGVRISVYVENGSSNILTLRNTKEIKK